MLNELNEAKEKEMLKEYNVEFTESENSYCYTGEWYSARVKAETEEEAIEFIKGWIDEQMNEMEFEIDENADTIFDKLESEKYIYRCKVTNKMIKKMHVIIYDTKVKKHIIYDDYCADEEEATIRAENNLMSEEYEFSYINEYMKIFVCEA